MGCRTEPAAVHIAHMLQKLHFFQFFNFFCNLHDLPQKKITRADHKKKTIVLYNLQDKRKKNTRIYRKKKDTRLDNFFLHTGYIFHVFLS